MKKKDVKFNRMRNLISHFNRKKDLFYALRQNYLQKSKIVECLMRASLYQVYILFALTVGRETNLLKNLKIAMINNHFVKIDMQNRGHHKKVPSKYFISAGEKNIVECFFVDGCRNKRRQVVKIPIIIDKVHSRILWLSVQKNFIDESKFLQTWIKKNKDLKTTRRRHDITWVRNENYEFFLNKRWKWLTESRNFIANRGVLHRSL